MSHLEEDELIQYAEDPDSVENVGPVEDHLRTCAECWQAVDFYRRLCDSFRAEETWDLYSGANDSKERREAAFFESRRAAEDASAEGLLAPYLRSAYEFGYADLSRKPPVSYGGCGTAALPRRSRSGR
jgi:hypothetical protein